MDGRNNVFVHKMGSGSKSGLYQQVWRDEQSYSDAHLETANLLAQLPNYQALCRVLSNKPNPRRLHQFRIELADKISVPMEVAQQRIDYVRSKSRAMCKYSRQGIEDYIARYTSSDNDESSYPIYDTQ